MEKVTILNKFRSLDMDNLEVVKKLAVDMVKWRASNRCYIDIEVVKTKSFKSIFVIHNVDENELSSYDSWRFLNDSMRWIKSYIEQNNDDGICDVFDFWNDKLDYLLGLLGDDMIDESIDFEFGAIIECGNIAIENVYAVEIYQDDDNINLTLIDEHGFIIGYINQMGEGNMIDECIAIEYNSCSEFNNACKKYIIKNGKLKYRDWY